MQRVRLFKLLTILAACASASCTIADQKAPDVTGPSELSRSIVVTATPDFITSNGVSQSLIGIVARDAYGQPLPNVQLRLDATDSAGVAKGMLSSQIVTTNNNGVASATFTSPADSSGGQIT